MPRSTGEALAWAREQRDDGGREWQGLCLKFVRRCFGIDAYYPSASAAWSGARFRHRLVDGRRVPRGVPFFWTGGSEGFGHVVLSAGGGMCWSSDVKVSGGISLVSINEITRRWGQRPRGWTEDLNNVRVWKPPEMPVVSLSDLERAFQQDPPRRTGATTDGSYWDVRRLERALLRAGYLDVRYVDGSYGTMTIAAMARFQRDRGLSGRGRPTLESVRAVGQGRFKVRA